MAGGYLGKISAVISANTGDYVRKLNESAKETRAFATTVQNTLSRASRDAAKSLESIYTPLQKVERALRAAASERLAFRGFDGVVRDVQSLQRALAKLQDQRTIDLVVKTSGLGSIEELKRTLNVLRNQDVTVGVEGLRAQRAALGNTNNFVVTTQVREEGQRLDSVIEALERIDAEKIKKISLQVEATQLKAAEAAFRQLIGLSTDLAKPLASATQTLSGLSLQVQANFLPVLGRAQQEVEKLNLAFSPARFTAAQRSVVSLTAAVNQLAEAERLAASVPTGRELAFSDPRLNANLSAAAAAGRSAASLPQQAIAGDPQLSGLTQQLSRVSQLAVEAAAKVKGAITGREAADARQEYDRLNAVLERLTQRLSQRIRIRLDADKAIADAQNLAFAITGKVQNIKQAESAYSGLVAKVSELDAVQRKAFGANLGALGSLVSSGDANKLQDIQSLIAQIQKDLVKQGKVSLDVSAARTTLQGLKGEIQKLDAAQRKAFSGNIRRLARLVSTDDESKLKAIAALVRQIDRDLAKQKALNVKTEETKKKVEDIRAALKGVVDALAGRSSDPFAQLRSSADAAKAAIDKVADARRKAALERQLGRIQSGIQADAAANLSPAQLAARARRRTSQLDALAGRAETPTAADIFGAPLRSAQQRTEALKSTIQSLQSQIAALPGPLQAGLIPQLNRARDAFAALGKNPTTAEIRAAVKEADRLEKGFQRVKAAAQFRGTFAGFLNSTAVERYSNQLSYVQRSLTAVGVTARGPVASAVNQFQKALEKAAAAGTIGTDRTKRRMEALIDRIAAAAVATGKLTQAQAASFATQAKGAGLRGDVGRFGVDKFNLGLQQLAFAVDDAFSVTGDFQQRIRAIGNNLTQLGFIVGGTTGLFVSLGAVIGLQVTSFLIKYINKGVEAEDLTKALNESLARQKSIVESLAQAFASLADEIGRASLSGPAEQARSFSKQLGDITRQQRELRESRVTELDATVQKERGLQNSLQKRLEATTDAGQRVALSREIRDSQERQRKAEAAAIRVPPPDQDQVLGAVLETIRPTEFLEGGRLRSRSFRQAAERQEKARADVARSGNVENLARVLNERLGERQRVASQDLTLGGFFGGENAEIARAREDVLKLKQLIESLDLPRNAEIDKKVEEFFKTLGGAAQELKVAQADAAEALRAGIPAAVALQGRLDELGKELEAAAKDIAQANEDFAEGRISVEERNRRVDEARAKTDDAKKRRADAQEEARKINFDRLINEPTGMDARISRAAASLQASGLGEGQLARDIRVIQARRANVEARLAAAGDNPEIRQKAQAELAALDEQIIALESATVALRKFTDYLDRAAQEADSNLQSARQAADQARRADLANPTARTGGARAGAEADLRRQEQLRNRVDDEVAKARARVEENARNGGPLAQEFARIREIDEQLKNGNLSAKEQARLIEERRRLQDRIDRAINQEQGVIDARDASTREEERRQSILRGRELTLTPGQRTRLELDQQLNDIEANRQRRIEDGVAPAVANREAAEARKRVTEEAFRSTAPAIFALADSVQNALLQGPSRAALQASDVSTVEGSRELSRLLRGDDAARNQDLVQLQKEANELLRAIKDNPANVAN